LLQHDSYTCDCISKYFVTNRWKYDMKISRPSPSKSRSQSSFIMWVATSDNNDGQRRKDTSGEKIPCNAGCVTFAFKINVYSIFFAKILHLNSAGFKDEFFQMQKNDYKYQQYVWRVASNSNCIMKTLFLKFYPLLFFIVIVSRKDSQKW
jgi:hypothetical protein